MRLLPRDLIYEVLAENSDGRSGNGCCLRGWRSIACGQSARELLVYKHFVQPRGKITTHGPSLTQPSLNRCAFGTPLIRPGV
jgi:hypothetical protein